MYQSLFMESLAEGYFRNVVQKYRSPSKTTRSLEEWALTDSVVQELPHTDIYRKWATTFTFLMLSY